MFLIVLTSTAVLEVAFICFTIGALYLIYVFSHCASLLQAHHLPASCAAQQVDRPFRRRAVGEGR